VRLQPHPLFLVVALALVAAGCSSERGGATTAATQTTAARGGLAIVAFVNDGDTLSTTSGKKVRLLQIDAPELHGDCFGKAALSALRQLTPKGTPVTLVRDPVLDQTDRYGRLLRYVIVNGTNVNVALVRGGTASPYFFRNEHGRYADALLAAVTKARAGKLGYWGACPKARLNTGLGSITGPG
jgi:micrococcal nuclease